MINFLSQLALAVALIMFIIIMLLFGSMLIITLVNICMEGLREIREGGDT